MVSPAKTPPAHDLVSPRVTIKDVARAAGVSVTTVSKVLNNAPTTVAISRDTRDRIHGVCRELGYRPNRQAQSLRSGRSRLIGLSMPVYFPGEGEETRFMEYRWDNDDQVPKRLRRFNAAQLDDLRSHYLGLGACMAGYFASPRMYEGWDLVLHLRNEALDRPFSANELQIDQFDGLIYQNPSARHLEYAEIARQGYPIVVDGRTCDAPWVPTVNMDNEEAGHMLAAHLMGLGRRRVLALWPYDKQLQATADRSAAAGRAARESGATLVERCVGKVLSINAGYEHTKAALEADPVIDAILCCHGSMAIGAIYAVEEAGRRVPEDVSVGTIGDGVENIVFEPAITSIRIPQAEVSRRAMEMLMVLLNGGKPDPLQQFLPPTLVVRRSCGGGAG